MYKGLFYDFESEEKFLALVNKIRGRCSKEENGCEIWSGSLKYDQPRYSFHDENGKLQCFPLRKIIFQEANPGFVLPDTPYKIKCSCDNDRCLNPDHIKITEKQYWDVTEILKRIREGSTLQPAAPGFEIGCLLWNGCTTPDGYGDVSVDSKKRRVHVVSLLIKDGIVEPPIGDNGKPLIVRHTCSNRNCSEPSHLCWGTPKENAEDRTRDGTHLVGADRPQAKISNETAAAVKQSWRPKNDPEYMPQAKRAEKFGVNLDTVRGIDCGRKWKHIPGPSNKPEKTRVSKKTLITRDDINDTIMETLVSRITAKVKITPNISKDPTITTPCHIFTGHEITGYGIIQYMNLSLRAHIIICEHKMKRRTPDGMVIRHMCGNRGCTNADHLQFGTRSENYVDALNHGDLGPRIKFTADDIRRIRGISLTDKDAIRKESKKYDVDYRYISGIIRGKQWTSIA